MVRLQDLIGYASILGIYFQKDRNIFYELFVQAKREAKVD
jgi:hypothetical protein